MELLEHEGKQIFRRYGLPVPAGELVRNPPAAVAAAAQLGGSCMVKAQVRQGGRGKAGLVKFADSPATVARLAADLFGIRTVPAVDALLIEQRLSIASEWYLAIKVDDVLGQPVVMASTTGGIDVESNADTIVTQAINVLDGLARHDAANLWKQAGLSGDALQAAAEFTLALWRAFWDSDADLMEINPVILDTAGKVWAADAKVNIDGNALYRHPELADAEAAQPGSALEQRARRLGVNTYLDLGGNISVISSGASFGMLMLDRIVAHGGQPGNFMDMGGRATGIAREKLAELVVYKAETDPSVKAIVVAFVLTSQSLKMITTAIVGAFGTGKLPCPVVSWIGATHVATQDLKLPDARAQLEALGIRTFDFLDQAIDAAVEAATK